MNTSVRAREGTEQHGLVRRDCMPLSKLGKFRGVTKQKSAHRAVVQYLGKQVNLGCFPSPKEAAHAFDRVCYVKTKSKQQINLPDLLTPEIVRHLDSLTVEKAIAELHSIRRTDATASRFKGVSFAKRQESAPHIAKICWNDQANTYFGICFKEEERAAIAADLLFVWRDGRHAQTNIPVSALQSMCGSIYVELASWRDAKKQMSRSTVQVIKNEVLKLSNDDVRSLIAAIPWRPSNVWELPPWQPQGTTKDMPRFEPPEIPNVPRQPISAPVQTFENPEQFEMDGSDEETHEEEHVQDIAFRTATSEESGSDSEDDSWELSSDAEEDLAFWYQQVMEGGEGYFDHTDLTASPMGLVDEGTLNAQIQEARAWFFKEWPLFHEHLAEYEDPEEHDLYLISMNKLRRAFLPDISLYDPLIHQQNYEAEDLEATDSRTDSEMDPDRRQILIELQARVENLTSSKEQCIRNDVQDCCPMVWADDSSCQTGGCSTVPFTALNDQVSQLELDELEAEGVHMKAATLSSFVL